MLSSPKFISVWDEYKAMRKKKKKPLTENAESRQLKRVSNLIAAGLSEKDVVAHLHDVIDSMWDNVYSNDQHFNDIVAKYTKPTNSHGKANQSGKSNSTSSNYFNYEKGTAYQQAAENLLAATAGFDFVEQIRL